MYVEKTENASISTSSHKQEPSSYFKGKAFVYRGEDSWLLKFSKSPSFAPSSFKIPFSVPLKEGQLLEVILKEHQGKWKIAISHSEIYEDIIEEKKEFFIKDESLLKKMNLPLEGNIAKSLDRFLSSSLWSRRWLAMALMDKRENQELIFLNLFGFLSKEGYRLKDLEDLVSKPFKSKKNSHYFWEVIFCEIEWGEEIKQATLNLCFSKIKENKELLAWFFVFPLKEDFLILKVKKNPYKAFLFLPFSWHSYKDTLVNKIKKSLPFIEWECIFKESVKESVDPWEEDFY